MQLDEKQYQAILYASFVEMVEDMGGIVEIDAAKVLEQVKNKNRQIKFYLEDGKLIWETEDDN